MRANIFWHYFCTGTYIGKPNTKLPYNKVTEYGISISGLPDNITLKHPSSYGKEIMKKILANKHLCKITGKESNSFVNHVCILQLYIYIYIYICVCKR